VPGTLKTLATGALLAAVVAMLAFVLAPRTHVVTAYLLPGIAIAAVLSPAIPTKVVYWLDPEGGPLTFFALTMACAFVFWALVFAGILRWRRARISS
jgi:hypothetical protein